MRLENSYMTGIGASAPNRAQAADGVEQKAGQGVGGAAEAGGSDHVELSTLAERLQVLSSHLAETGEGSAAREAKLKDLAGLVASGKYAPNVDQVSATLIDGMLAEKP